MLDTDLVNYRRIEQAIKFIKQNHREQPSLDQIAQHVNLSPFHFQRLFTEWAGTSPKKFLQYTSIKHAKQLLKEPQSTLFDVSNELGLSSTSRLHDLFVNIEAMSPAEYKNHGRDLSISYSFLESFFGHVIIASTPKGICFISFEEDHEKALFSLKSKFNEAIFHQENKTEHLNAIAFFKGTEKNPSPIKLHLKGTDFQLKVWEALLKIPLGKLKTYGNIAEEIGSPAASRAVGTAIGSNPIAYLIPCHRVIQGSGHLGGYMWGEDRKTAMIGRESVLVEIA
jgi:AraC family transcriptional regulator, regulatory protein of adaptative response / methylated-DNA-[protein]-cysteine methyltransferase